ncbi:hypothetical protein IC582_002843 [Cucumis melo]|uniref:Calmodulin-binding protein 60 B-like isoform X2 n=1 Tax=Cucumis melo TaxID=3656 RepID=A0A1S3BPF4_CUCME|nr:calmodulin-binding protein 60 B-like isoform X2 [Cucumis melo]
MEFPDAKTFFCPQNYQTTSSHYSFPSGFGVGGSHLVLSPKSVAYVENYFRPLIRKEVEAKINAHFNVSTDQSCSNSSTSREGVLGEDRAVVIVGGGRLRKENQQQLKLRFTNKVPSTIYTVNDVEAENGEELRVELFDVVNDRIIDVTHPLSSARIEVVVLDREFNDGEAITQSDFNRSVVPQRLGERPLLVGGHKRFRLENGVYSITDLSFTRNSSRCRTKKIRLGLRVINDSNNNNYPTIGHAVSNPFRVKDHRGQLNQKRHPPKGEDEVWRLEGIGRNGEYHKRLTSHGILYVDDFLKAYQKDSRSLRKWLGNRVSDKKWKSMVKHAHEYVPITNTIVPTFDPPTSFQQNLVENKAMGGVEEVSNQNNIGDGFQDHTSLLADVIQDHFHRIFQDFPTQTLLSQGEASTSNGYYNYVEHSTSTCNQHFLGAVLNKLGA